MREETVLLAGPAAAMGFSARLTLGMSQPSIMEDGWWLSTLWASDADGVIDAHALTGAATRPEPPVAFLGRIMAGALSGLLAQEGGRQLIRLRMPPPASESRPWDRPMLIWLAVRWDPVRASVMRTNELAREVLRGFARAVEAAAERG